MDDSIFEDLERLFEECDDVTKTFYKSSSKNDTIVDNANGSDVLGDARGCKEQDHSKLSDFKTCDHSVKGGLVLQSCHRAIDSSTSVLESSREEGECTRSLDEAALENTLHDTVLKPKLKSKVKIKPKNNYSSFIESSKEEGECSTTSCEEDDLETTIKAASSERADEKCSESDKENDKLLIFKDQSKERDKSCCPIGKKRKRSLLDKNESTPKRRHLFVTDDVISPISCCSEDKRRNTHETGETPVIESKFSLHASGICSSTPVTTDQKFLFPKSGLCSTPVSAAASDRESKLAKKEILKTEVSSDSDSEFQAFSDVEEKYDKNQTVEELIAEITQLCEDESANEVVETETENNINSSDKNLSKIEVNELINEWKTRSSCESGSESTDGDDDRTLTENTDVGTDNTDSDIENLTVISATGVFKNDKMAKEMNASVDRSGRFKTEVTVLRIEEGKGNETNRETVDMDVSDDVGEDIQHGDDLLNLNDYDDEGFVDENILENSHLTKDINLTIKTKETRKESKGDTDKGKVKKTEENVDSLFHLVQSLRKAGEKTGTDKEVDVNRNTVRELDYAAFDTSIYRKKDNTAIEKEICRRWGTDGSADPDVNLTVATTERNRYRALGQKPKPGYLEGDKVVCTYLYENEVVSKFRHYGKTDGQSDLCFMTLGNLLRKLHNQKEILENMNKQSLLNIKGELEWQLQGTKERHIEEMASLRHRQVMEEEQFRFNTRNQFNLMEIQNNLMKLKQEHVFQVRKLKEHHQFEYNAVRSHGMEILNEEISRHGVQCEPINQLIGQLNGPKSKAISSTQKYGPPIVVSLRKGPCKASDGKHSTVAVCLSAGIAQAVSLEDDLYDHYYSY